MSQKLFKPLVFAVLPAIFLILSGELGARFLLFFRYGNDPLWLIAPFGWQGGDRYSGDSARRHTGDSTRMKKGVNQSSKLVTIFMGPARWKGNIQFDFYDTCEDRTISFRFNKLGYRGPDWTERPAINTLRILALGGSSTLGVTNPEDKAWPSLLEEAFRIKRGKRVEVLNGGRNAEKLEQITAAYKKRLNELGAHIVVYYGGYNEVAVDSLLYIDVSRMIDHLNKKILPWLYKTIYSRSMLYTILLEKYANWRVLSNSKALVPDIGSYIRQLKKLAQEVKLKGSNLLIVIQENRLPRGKDLTELNLQDTEVVKAYVTKPVSGFKLLQSIRMRQHHILMEALRRLPSDAFPGNVRVVDLSDVIASHPDRNRIFCDSIHLTDLGNSILVKSLVSFIP